MSELPDRSISEDPLQTACPFIKTARRVSDPTERDLTLCDSRSKHQSLIGMPRRDFPADLFHDLTKHEMQRVLEILHFAAWKPDLRTGTKGR